jgi:chromosome segregation ATPase
VDDLTNVADLKNKVQMHRISLLKAREERDEANQKLQSLMHQLDIMQHEINMQKQEFNDKESSYISQIDDKSSLINKLQQSLNQMHDNQDKLMRDIKLERIELKKLSKEKETLKDQVASQKKQLEGLMKQSKYMKDFDDDFSLTLEEQLDNAND